MELTREQIEECRANPTQAMIRREQLCDLALRGLGTQEPVAWVEVLDTDEGPYNFHGMKLMSKGKHYLYAAPAMPTNYTTDPQQGYGGGGPASSAGTVAVPREPTPEMCQAGQDKAREWPRFPLRIVPIWQAMLAAAPAVESRPEERDNLVRAAKAMCESFRRELAELLNRYSMENASNTPDFILADYLIESLRALATTIQQRETWYGRDARPSHTADPTDI